MEAGMHVAEIWRYPVKSMAGEMLDEIEVGGNGIPGDRIGHAGTARGRVLTARTHPGLLSFHATLGADGVPRVDGRSWDDAGIARLVHERVAPTVQLVADETGRFDVLPLLVATDGAIAALGVDHRR